MLNGYINFLILRIRHYIICTQMRHSMVLFTEKLVVLYNLHWNLRCRKPCRCHMPTNIRRSEYISYGKTKTRRYIECIERSLNVEKFCAATGLQNHRRIYATYCSAQISQNKHIIHRFGLTNLVFKTNHVHWVLLIYWSSDFAVNYAFTTVLSS